MWLKHLIIHLCPKLNFPPKKQFSQDILPFGKEYVEKTNELYVFLAFAKCYSTTSFDLWMSKGINDVFALVIIFLCNDC